LKKGKENSMNKQELSKQIANQMKEFERLGGLIDYRKPRKIRVKKSVYTGTNKRGGRKQELRGWDAVVPSASASYGFGGWYAEWKEEQS
jgi:hypothetical protein